MTRTAREVLKDCRGAVEEIGGGVQGRAWRRRWVTAVVLLRTVGYAPNTKSPLILRGVGLVNPNLDLQSSGNSLTKNGTT
jgi:hypothetical protein